MFGLHHADGFLRKGAGAVVYLFEDRAEAVWTEDAKRHLNPEVCLFHLDSA